MTLADFLKTPDTMVARERLLHAKVAYEMRLHAAREGHQFQMTEPEIDNEGFDFSVVLDYTSLFVQNKAAVRPGGARSWEILAKLLKPHFNDRDTIPELDGRRIGGYEVGATGAVLVHLVDVRHADQDDQLKVAYLYFDIYYAIAVAAGYIKAGFSPDEAKALIRQIRDAAAGDRIRIKQKHCLEIATPASVLAFRFGLGGQNYMSPLPKSLDGAVPQITAAPLADIWRRSLSGWTR